ncbi:hypothetical protein JB92DRAFT_661814 [Gautieria morchelliformis]|nr:hypothetical protein JB92DRAFT_661814 [Gautieria morchelliformis]
MIMRSKPCMVPWALSRGHGYCLTLIVLEFQHVLGWCCRIARHSSPVRILLFSNPPHRSPRRRRRARRRPRSGSSTTAPVSRPHTMAGKRRLGPLIITNPTESDSDSDSDALHHTVSVSPRGALDSIEPPAPIFTHSHSRSHDDLSASSRSSPAPDTTPPPTPSQPNPPAAFAGVVFDNSSHKAPPFHAQAPNLLSDRDTDCHGIGRAPHHNRRPSNDPVSNPSPTLSISHNYIPVSPTTDHLEQRIIMATGDSSVYHKVNITSSRSGEAIRELIFSALQIPDEDQLGFALYQDTEPALDDPLNNDTLFDLCNRCADRMGSLKFIIQRRNAQIYLRPDIRALPPPPIIAPPVPHDRDRQPHLPHIGTSVRSAARQGTRPSPHSQHSQPDTASSTSDRRVDIAPTHLYDDRRIDLAPNYDASLSDGFETPSLNTPRL